MGSDVPNKRRAGASVLTGRRPATTSPVTWDPTELPEDPYKDAEELAMTRQPRSVRFARPKRGAARSTDVVAKRNEKDEK
eukprot:1185682-Prorocentrum_minimum.AAC.2